MKIKHYSVLPTLLQDFVAKTAFKKGWILMFQLSATVCTMLNTAEHLKCLAFNKYQVCCFLICFLFSKAKIN